VNMFFMDWFGNSKIRKGFKAKSRLSSHGAMHVA
jgi:hypothetical protein